MAIDVDVLGERYLSLAHDREGKLVTYDKPPLRELNASEHESLRESLLGLRAPLRPNQHVRFAPGGQFWVARSRILARPRSFYAALYDAVTDPRHPQLGEGRSSSIQLYAKRPGLGVFFMEALPPRRPPSLALAFSLSLSRARARAQSLLYPQPACSLRPKPCLCPPSPPPGVLACDYGRVGGLPHAPAAERYAALPFINFSINRAARLEMGFTCDNPTDWRRRARSTREHGACTARLLPFEGA